LIKPEGCHAAVAHTAQNDCSPFEQKLSHEAPIQRLHRCIPTRAYRVPSGPGWVHEVKHDGYRLQVHSQGDAVRLFTRRGYDWSKRYPAIVRTAASSAARHSRSMARLWSAVRMASPSSMPCTAAARSVRPCCTLSRTGVPMNARQHARARRQVLPLVDSCA
jgi:hypothetical protein